MYATVQLSDRYPVNLLIDDTPVEHFECTAPWQGQEVVECCLAHRYSVDCVLCIFQYPSCYGHYCQFSREGQLAKHQGQLM